MKNVEMILILEDGTWDLEVFAVPTEFFDDLIGIADWVGNQYLLQRDDVLTLYVWDLEPDTSMDDL